MKKYNDSLLHSLLIMIIIIGLISLNFLITGKTGGYEGSSTAIDHPLTIITFISTIIVGLLTAYKLNFISYKKVKFISILVAICGLVWVSFLLSISPWDNFIASKGKCNLIIKYDVFEKCNLKKLFLEEESKGASICENPNKWSMSKSRCYFKLAIEKNNVTLCKFVENKPYNTQDSCYIILAEQNKDQNICNNISNYVDIRSCKRRFGKK